MLDCASVTSFDQSRVENAIFSYLWSMQTLSDPKVIDRIKMELFGATTIIRKVFWRVGMLLLMILVVMKLLVVVVVLLLGLMMLLLQFFKKTIMSMIILVIQILPLLANVSHANMKTARQNMM